MRTSGLVGYLTGAAALLAWTAGAGADGVHWAESFSKAKKKAKESGSLMMVDFWADW